MDADAFRQRKRRMESFARIIGEIGMKIFLAILMLTTLAPIVFSQKIKPDAIVSIMLRDEGSFGYDKETEIVLQRDGGTTYYGGKNSARRQGKFHGAISRKDFAKLAKLVVAENFFQLKNRYEGKINDIGTKTITIIYKNGEKSVINWGGSDLKAFVRIEHLISEIAENVQWVKH